MSKQETQPNYIRKQVLRSGTLNVRFDEVALPAKLLAEWPTKVQDQVWEGELDKPTDGSSITI